MTGETDAVKALCYALTNAPRLEGHQIATVLKMAGIPGERTCTGEPVEIAVSPKRTPDLSVEQRAGRVIASLHPVDAAYGDALRRDNSHLL